MNKCPVCKTDVSNVPLSELLLDNCPNCNSAIMTVEQFKKEQLAKDKKEQMNNEEVIKTSEVDDYSANFVNERKAR